jgi:hypothetical protein
VKHTTICTLCHREVSARQNWNSWQAGRNNPDSNWRVVRHRATDKRTQTRQHGEVICPGGGIQVHPNNVLHQEVSA